MTDAYRRLARSRHATRDQVQRRRWEPFRQPRTLIDTMGDPPLHVERIRSAVGGPDRPGSLD